MATLSGLPIGTRIFSDGVNLPDHFTWDDGASNHLQSDFPLLWALWNTTFGTGYVPETMLAFPPPLDPSNSVISARSIIAYE